MANQRDLDAHYTVMDKLFRYSIGEMGAYSCARYDGDFSMKLIDAQQKKHEFIAKHLNIGKGTKVLDLGCGWGAWLKYVNDLGGEGYGVVLAKGQADACIKNRLNVKHMDSKLVNEETFGTKFDVITAMGSPEHLCSIEEYKAGKQDEIYRNYYRQLSDLIPVGGKIYIQTMVFGKNIMPIEEVPFGNVYLYKKAFTDPEILAILCDVFPGSWLSYGSSQMIETAKPHFKLLSVDCGRLDYMETIRQWTHKFKAYQFQKYLLYASYIPRYLTNRKFRQWLRRFFIGANIITFEREILDHYRMVFEKIE